MMKDMQKPNSNHFRQGIKSGNFRHSLHYLWMANNGWPPPYQIVFVREKS